MARINVRPFGKRPFNPIRPRVEIVRPGRWKESSTNPAIPGDTRPAPHVTDGRTVQNFEIVTTYQVLVPQRDGTRTVLVRIVAISTTAIKVRMTAIPGEPRLAVQRRVWIEQSDLRTLLTTGLAARFRQTPCPSCGSAMTTYYSSIGRHRRPAIVLACSGCEECLEI